VSSVASWRPAMACEVCGCSAELDAVGDRICWCDACSAGGCRPRPPPAFAPGSRVLFVRIRSPRDPGRDPLGGPSVAELRVACEQFGEVDKISAGCQDGGGHHALVQFASESSAFAALQALDGVSITGDGRCLVDARYSGRQDLLIEFPLATSGQRVVHLHVKGLRNPGTPPMGGLSLDDVARACEQFGDVQRICCSKPAEPISRVDVLVEFASNASADALCSLDGGASLTEDGYNCTWASYSTSRELVIKQRTDRARDFADERPGGRRGGAEGGGVDAPDPLPRPEPAAEAALAAGAARDALRTCMGLAIERLSACAEEHRPKSRRALCAFLHRRCNCARGVRAFVVDPVEVLHLLLLSEEAAPTRGQRLHAVEALAHGRPAPDQVVRLRSWPSDCGRVLCMARSRRIQKLRPEEFVLWLRRQAFVSVPVTAAEVLGALVAEGLVRELGPARDGSDVPVSCHLPAVVRAAPEDRGEGASGGEGGTLALPAQAPAEYPPVENFDDLRLSEGLLRGIYSFGFVDPCPVQRFALRPLLDGRHTVIQSASGTGKTAAFAIAALHRCDARAPACQALILAPGRELVEQIRRVVLALGEYLAVRCHSLVGGTSVRDDIDKLRNGPHIVVGTPGRVQDMLSKRHLRAARIVLLVVDEADVLLSPGSSAHLRHMLGHLPPRAQKCLCSATVSAETMLPLAKSMPMPAMVCVQDGGCMPRTVRHFYLRVETAEQKLDRLCDLHWHAARRAQAMVFCTDRRKVDRLHEQLARRDMVSSVLHAELDQKERDLVMREFRSGSSRVIITSDLLARGIDVQQVYCVINYDVPHDPVCYLHQAGRAGRFGREGVAITLVGGDEVASLRHIELRCGIQVAEMPREPGDCF